jgi:hypothetical protein
MSVDKEEQRRRCVDKGEASMGRGAAQASISGKRRENEKEWNGQWVETRGDKVEPR